jgi:hypothetical protein
MTQLHEDPWLRFRQIMNDPELCNQLARKLEPKYEHPAWKEAKKWKK